MLGAARGRLSTAGVAQPASQIPAIKNVVTTSLRIAWRSHAI